ncbi:sterol desaturase [Amylibacter ulvae]|uniref:Sterol desaturase n=1 Tax=Paramylibacter ulvae TaxID=1651968 RepID=A0ABQ3D7W8_9RHOB|nr:sterol desaturase family protein [Amylibacter ulvae]GHA57437.1 sterol desaturase [Amylibacter ulvae]
MSLIKKFVAALEKPRAERPFGSGWLSGTLSLICGVAALALAIVLRYPHLFSTPDLAVIHEFIPFRVAFQIFIVFGYVLSFTSLILSRSFMLSSVGFFLVVAASLIQGPAESGSSSMYFGLDFFVLKVLTVGILFLPLERMFPHDPDQTVLRFAWREDFFYFAVSSLLVQALNYLTLAPSEVVNNNFDITEMRHYIFTLPLFIQVFLIMLATDFMQYWLHYAFHKVPFLWRFHSIHHSTQQLDWIAGARMHFFEIAVLRSVTALPMLTLGFDPAAIQVYLIIVYFYSALVHSNLGFNLSFIERWLVTPRFHHWHHGSEREAIDINFAIHFPLFDWLFGTYHMPEDRWPDKYGVAGEDMPKGYFKQFLHPFRAKKKLPPAE